MTEIDPRVKVYSFDIFDTLLTRSVAQPYDIFKIVQSRLNPEEYSFPEGFLSKYDVIRRNIEWLVRHKCEKEEISFKDIFDALGETYNLGEPALSHLKRVELDVETESIFPISWSKTEINTLRKSQNRIIFTSDTYLPRDFIKRLLLKFKLYEEKDGLYLSNEVGFRKSTGNLFKYLLGEEDCQSFELSHFGDDIYSDLIVPFKLGINIYKTPQHLVRRTIKSYQFKNVRVYLLRPFFKLFNLLFRKNSKI
jgi:predicted HAD superfamily hydrolase